MHSTENEGIGVDTSVAYMSRMSERGGNDECKIRPCASDRKLSDCIECNEIKTCKNLEALQKVHTGALHVGMLAKTDNDKGDQQLTKKWTAETKSKCLYCGA